MSDAALDLDAALALENSVWSAVVSGDGDALADLFTDDYVEVTVDGLRALKDSIVSQSPQVDRIEAHSIAEATLVKAGPTAAVLSYRLELDGTLRGEPIRPVARWVASVWRRDGSEWRCCFFQQTRIPDDDVS